MVHDHHVMIHNVPTVPYIYAYIFLHINGYNVTVTYYRFQIKRSEKGENSETILKKYKIKKYRSKGICTVLILPFVYSL